MHDGRRGLHDVACFSCSMAVKERKEGGVRNDTTRIVQKRGIQKKRGHQLSFVGRGFFSCVSVFFSLDLSNFSTSARSGLSLIVAVSLRKDGTTREMINIIPPASPRKAVQQKTKH